MGTQISSHGAPEIPEELSGPLPRKVELAGDDAYFLIWVVLIFIVGGSAVCGWWAFASIKQAHQRTVLRSEGRQVVGKVTRLLRGRGTEYVRYSFKVSGRDFAGEARIPNSSKIILNNQDLLVIRFLPSDPTINHPDAWEWSWLMDLFPIGFQIFFATIVCVALFLIQRDRRLIREGRPVLGVVISCTPKDRQFCIGYELRTEEAMLIIGKSDRKEPQEIGSQTWILYLPKKPNRNDLYPLPGYNILG